MENQDRTFIPPFAVSHYFLKTEIVKAYSERVASFFRWGVTEQGVCGSDCKPLTFPVFHEASGLPSCSRLACSFCWSPRWWWQVSAGGRAHIHHHAWKGTQGSCPVADGSGAAAFYVKDIIFNSSAFSLTSVSPSDIKIIMKREPLPCLILYALLSSNYRHIPFSGAIQNHNTLKIIISYNYGHVVMVSLFLTAGIKWSFGRKKEISLHPIENFLRSESTIKRTQKGASVPKNHKFGLRAFGFVFVEIDYE